MYNNLRDTDSKSVSGNFLPNTETNNTQAPNDESKSFHFTTTIDDTTSPKYEDFTIHILCLNGTAKFQLRDRVFSISSQTCVVLMNNTTLKWLFTSSDFKMEALFVANEYLEASTPGTNYNFMGMLSLMEHPVIEMDRQKFNLCIAVIEAIRSRVKMQDHLFYSGVLRRAVETLMLDIYSIHSKLYPTLGTGRNQGVKIFREFIQLIEQGNYRTNREVKWYAKKMNISPKYLSEVSQDVSGHSASFWINRFTIGEISRLLHNPTLSINTISDMLHFTTHSYFSHYVRDRLGMTPKDYRQKMLGVRK